MYQCIAVDSAADQFVAQPFQAHSNNPPLSAKHRLKGSYVGANWASLLGRSILARGFEVLVTQQALEHAIEVGRGGIYLRLMPRRSPSRVRARQPCTGWSTPRPTTKTTSASRLIWRSFCGSSGWHRGTPGSTFATIRKTSGLFRFILFRGSLRNPDAVRELKGNKHDSRDAS
jgi:hypothetical protein